MSPLDALTLQRLRSLEIVVAWLVGIVVTYISGRTDPRTVVDSFMEDFAAASDSPTYILELAEQIQGEEEDA